MKIILHLSSLTRTPFSPPFPPLSKPISAAARTKPLSISFQHEEAEKRSVELRVCTNRTCRRQGSLESLQVLSGIAPPHVSVTACGCLGKCGAGPNVVVVPDAVFIKHCGTPARAAEIMSFLCLGRDGSDIATETNKCLEALALRKRAEDEMDKANFSEAFHLLSQAIYLKPFGGVHISYRNRSVARLAMEDPAGALQDAKEALNIAPTYSDAYLCQGDALMALDQIEAAENSYSVALDLDPSIRRSKSFKVRIAKLKEKLTPAI
ncbi:PREDICTED: uncharacterized protein LOC109193706 isoform X1 [Ipomoea nil]|uniref:uncharacterized protein LOC109193706 isoform X1 n=1 Tax=Ipomoea nil TaxID=35883 RepID=UPI00090155AD|nr:PREDICTED: uncharacterized protein LOC109193706 isoform X1 [Ipomoea nil]